MPRPTLADTLSDESGPSRNGRGYPPADSFGLTEVP